MNLKKFASQTADLLLPPLCPATGEMVDCLGMVDASYWQNLNFIAAPLCDQCGTPYEFDLDGALCGACLDQPPFYSKARSALFYDDHSRDLILRFKHGDQTHAVKVFTPWLLQAGHDVFADHDVMIPIPLHRYRLIKRRYNQAALIAQDLAKYFPDKDYWADGLTRIKNTQSQGHKTGQEREKNLRNAFQVNDHYGESVQGKKILLIDDVMTSGATVNEASRVLLAAGACDVNVLTLAKVVKR